MSDKDKQPLAASASAAQVAESADAALKHIVDGFLHFHHDVFPQQEELFKKLATAQNPRAMFITCADSRIVPELITQSAPGGATETLSYYINRVAWDGPDFGYASAISVVVLMITVILAQVLVRRYFRSGTES